ncbi:TATA box-binding protein-associated factor RNA polymerase I subunit B-like [Quercus lobata]|uniref:TATA box-binding protein-associated factor RNA polymerase I subunit B-like n=1 Tax=Quercus lobata TaxID=97700 RepID=UPI001244D039|nr:TATA box-binding protein-associated factor RNA polymerase I subunit B-like [Quercus lobata]
MADPKNLACQSCGFVGLSSDSDGYFCCDRCGAQAEDFIETGVADEDFVDKGFGGGAVYFWNSLNQNIDNETTPIKKEEEFYEADVDGPTGPEDFGGSVKVKPTFEDYYHEIRIRYVLGFQYMIQFQCEALVREFKVSPLICGLAGTIWMRFVACSAVSDDDWADQTIQNSEMERTSESSITSFKISFGYAFDGMI